MSRNPRAHAASDPVDAERAFYARCLAALNAANVPFLVGGAYAMRHYSGIVRKTKDLDLFLMRKDLDDARRALEQAGYRTELCFSHWLAKAYFGPWFVDIIFDSGNGATQVDEGWFTHASRSRLLGFPVLVCPIEETILSKAFVMERERYDGADVAHLIRASAEQLDWARLIERFGPNGRVLLAHLVLFGFVYPHDAHRVPEWVMDRLWADAKREQRARPRQHVCRGTLLSREQYLHDIHHGDRDGRLPPTGGMSPQAIAAWTAAIGRR